jgi:diadenosine tetraphosphate (Ap4A) HIT family hydrolase
MRQTDCVFCDKSMTERHNLIIENELAYAIWDIRPVAPGHALVIPKEHRENYFELDQAQIGAILELSQAVKEIVDTKFKPDGYNVFTNVGTEAGQVVMHAHVHLVPRHRGDTVIKLGDRDRPDLE